MNPFASKLWWYPWKNSSSNQKSVTFLQRPNRYASLWKLFCQKTNDQ